MRDIPIHPVIRMRVAQILHDQFGMTPKGAVDTATKLIRILRDNEMDIVMGDWMGNPEEPLQRRSSFTWDDLPRIAQELEESGRAPWDAPELQ
jgi:hypothetical protein